MLLESDSSWLTVAGPYLLCYCLPSLVLTAPVRGSTPTLCCPLLCCPAANCPRPGPPSTASLLDRVVNARLLSNTNCPLPGRVVNSHSRPLTTSGYGEISGPRILCLVSRQNRQLNRLLWQPNHIVLQKHAKKNYRNFSRDAEAMWNETLESASDFIKKHLQSLQRRYLLPSLLSSLSLSLSLSLYIYVYIVRIDDGRNVGRKEVH